MKKTILGIIKWASIIYGVLFLVFFFDLDGKFLYYVWEPNIKTHYAKMKRDDATKTPYEQMKDVSL